ncbi:aminopeptidase [Aerococcus kribbianus]|uniref:Aminopeptidase n=1 Tax=Aerococcus kribbianus TaxID=2999064 RepID=A0A9X3FP05_9LACT|nr:MULTISPECIES: aminopeptidase [unclassified Aerococcus]MCZ0717293.1 aminopeptidase [Aerococcus sp. YH-aer221]MCZ0725581.1 aminopeptidase [Aerococcus sp. YH-aer222]
MKNFNELLDRYAHLLINKGVNVEAGDNLMIYIETQNAPLGRLLAKHAYANGAERVYFTWRDEVIQRLEYENVDTENLANVPDYEIDRQNDLIKNKKISRLSIVSGDPDLLNGIANEKIDTVQNKRSQSLKMVRQATMNDDIKWTVAAAADFGWAKHIFSDLADQAEKATMALWEEIFKTCRVYADDPVDAWNQHRDTLDAHADYLNKEQFSELHYRAPGTDLHVGLPKNHIWMSAESFTPENRPFIANMPTEEVFTAPDTRRISGHVTSTKPLAYAGTTIENIYVEFEDGQITKITADKGQQIIQDLVFNNDGARGLGEVALVAHDSPISQSNLIFYNTLFDENASNHLAIGAAYPTTIENGTKLSEEELAQEGLNISPVHVDFMIGSAEMDVDGITANGERKAIFRKGNWAL